jgi:hypothetical protein
MIGGATVGLGAMGTVNAVRAMPSTQKLLLAELGERRIWLRRHRILRGARTRHRYLGIDQVEDPFEVNASLRGGLVRIEPAPVAPRAAYLSNSSSHGSNATLASTRG